MDFFSLMIILFIIAAVVGFVVKVVFWIWVARSAWNAYKVYNAEIESGLRQLAMAMQAHQAQQAIALQQAMRQQVATLPRSERITYKRKLSDVVSGKKVLNPATGEWEDG